MPASVCWTGRCAVWWWWWCRRHGITDWVCRCLNIWVFGEVDDKKVRNLVHGVELDDGVARFEDVVYAGGEGMNHTFYVVINEGRNREVRRLCGGDRVG